MGSEVWRHCASPPPPDQLFGGLKQGVGNCVGLSGVAAGWHVGGMGAVQQPSFSLGGGLGLLRSCGE